MLGDHLRGHIDLTRTGGKISVADQAVYVFFFKAGISYRIGRGFQVKTKGCSSGHFSLGRVSHTDYGISVFKIIGTQKACF